MKNYEKYADEIREFDGTSFCNQFVIPHILEADNCNGIDCQRCPIIKMIWLLERKVEKISSNSDAVYVLYADGTWRKKEK